MNRTASLTEEFHSAGEQGRGGILFYGKRRGPDEPGVPQFLTVGQLQAEAFRIAGGLRSAGCRRGDLVKLTLNHSRDFIPAFWGCLVAGLVAVPRPASGADIAGAADSPALPQRPGRRNWSVVDEATPEDAAEAGGLAISALCAAQPVSAHHQPGRDETAILLATSGTTADPRWVALSHENVLTSITGSAQINGYSSRDVSLNWLPLYHIGGLLRSLRELHLGCLQIQVPSQAVAVDPLYWLDLLERHSVTMTWAPNFGFSLLAASLRSGDGKRGPWNLGALRSLHSSGEPVKAVTMLELWRQLRGFGLRDTALHTAWGMTEVCFATCSHRVLADLQAHPDRPPTVGRAIAGVSLQIVDESGRRAADGSVGRLQVCGPAVGRYLNSEGIERACSEDRWLDTGDLGSITDGVLTVTGRARDLIIVRGRKFSPLALEATVEQIAGVIQGAVVACPVQDEEKGEGAVALFLSSEGNTKRQIVSLVHTCREQIARHHGITVRWILPVAARDIPRSAVGKVKRWLLAARWLSGEIESDDGWPFDLQSQAGATDANAARAAETGPVGEVAAAFANALGGRQINNEMNFFAQGGDSLGVMKVIEALAERFPAADLSAVDLYRWPTVQLLAGRIEGLADSALAGGERTADSHRQRRRARRLAQAAGATMPTPDSQQTPTS